MLLAANFAGLLAALVRSDDLFDVAEQFALIATTLEPALLVTLVCLHGPGPWLRSIGYLPGAAIVLVIAAYAAFVTVPLSAVLVIVLIRQRRWPWLLVPALVIGAVVVGMIAVT